MRAYLAAVILALSVSVASAQAPVQGVTEQRATVNGSVVIATGNTFQTVLASSVGATVAANAVRQALTIENNNASDNCWIAFGTVAGVVITAANATKGESILLLPGGSFTRYWPYIPSDAIQGTCAANSDTLYIDTQ